MPRGLALPAKIAFGVALVLMTFYFAYTGWQVSAQLAFNGLRRPSGFPNVFVQLAGALAGAVFGIVLASCLMALASFFERRFGNSPYRR